ncbi:MAG: hypothetical protein EZS28_013655 [Streblomastix strix]|uniref:Uncharacterized protein n=1 Tax=Streblomastix strix TaxID=222440 RepID=A0A5J4W7I5_9EUKA|nr:MAG: hypothetical protein EZS28_013655 [Streblomastix strix]
MMLRRINNTIRQTPSKDSNKAPNCTQLESQKPATCHYPLDPDSTIATPEEVPPNAITDAQALLAELSWQETSQIIFFVDEPSEEQIIDAKQFARAASNLVELQRPSKHNNLPTNVIKQKICIFKRPLCDLILDFDVEFKSQSPYDKSKGNEVIRIYEMDMRQRMVRE